MVALVVVVAGSLLTLVAARLEEVSASAVTERVNDSDAFLHDSTLCTRKRKTKLLNKYSLVYILFFYFSDAWRVWDRECNACNSNSIVFSSRKFEISQLRSSFNRPLIISIVITSIYHEFILHCVTYAISQLSCL